MGRILKLRAGCRVFWASGVGLLAVWAGGSGGWSSGPMPRTWPDLPRSCCCSCCCWLHLPGVDLTRGREAPGGWPLVWEPV